MQNLKTNSVKLNQAYIAQKLDLSIGTVSKALRNQPEISSETSRKIREFAQSIGYSKIKEPILNKNKSGYYLAGVLVNSSTYRASRGGYLEGISKESVNRNFSIVTHYAGEDDSRTLLEGNGVPWVLRDPSLVNGLILIHKWPRSVLEQIANRFVCVSIMHDYSDQGIDFVGVNGESGIFALMDYLYNKGHHKIGFFGHNKEISWSRSRFSGYMNAVCKFGMEINSDLVVEVEKEYPEESRRSWDQYFDSIADKIKQGVDAWVCASDLAAYELCNGLRKRGFRIPDDVAVTGFDSNSVNCLEDFAVTSVKVPSEQMGAAALAMIELRKSNPGMPRQVQLFDCEFVKGQTA
jgi:LacI family transcriptional regulator